MCSNTSPHMHAHVHRHMDMHGHSQCTYAAVQPERVFCMQVHRLGLCVLNSADQAPDTGGSWRTKAAHGGAPFPEALTLPSSRSPTYRPASLVVLAMEAWSLNHVRHSSSRRGRADHLHSLGLRPPCAVMLLNIFGACVGQAAGSWVDLGRGFRCCELQPHSTDLWVWVAVCGYVRGVG